MQNIQLLLSAILILSGSIGCDKSISNPEPTAPTRHKLSANDSSIYAQLVDVDYWRATTGYLVVKEDRLHFTDMSDTIDTVHYTYLDSIITPEVVLGLYNANQDMTKWSDYDFNIGIPCKIISQQEIDDLTSSGWTKFYSKYTPYGLMVFSSIGYNHDSTVAVAYLEKTSSSSDVVYFRYSFIKQNGIWQKYKFLI